MAACKVDTDMLLADTLQRLNCPLVGNKEDIWIKQLFFEPGSHRFQLFDWIFHKMGFDEMGETPNPEGKTVEDYHEDLLAMGVCNQSDIKLVTGEAPKSKQLKFWKMIIDLLYVTVQLESEDTSATDDDEILATENPNTDDDNNEILPKELCQQKKPEDSEDCVFSTPRVVRNIDTEYEKCSAMMKNIIKNVNVPDLFLTKCFSLAPDIEKDIDHILSTNVEEVNKLPDPKHSLFEESDNKIYSSLIPAANHSANEASTSHSMLSTEDEKVKTLTDFQVLAKQFTEAYNELKPVLLPSDVTSSNFGEEFEKIRPHMEWFSKVMSYLDKTKSINETLEEESSSLQDLKLGDLRPTAGELENYITVLQENLHSTSKDAQ